MNDWISVNERLPKVDHDVIVAGKIIYQGKVLNPYFVNVGWLDKGGGGTWSFYECCEDGEAILVEHWREFPAHPDKHKEETK